MQQIFLNVIITNAVIIKTIDFDRIMRNVFAITRNGMLERTLLCGKRLWKVQPIILNQNLELM
jgi:hypothetical protein